MTGVQTCALPILTPALAVVLTAVLAALGREHGRMIVVVDEAHRITIDPDAGDSAEDEALAIDRK